MDALLTGAALFLALILRFGGDIPGLYFDHFEQVMGPVAVIHVGGFLIFGVYKRLWNYYELLDYLMPLVAIISSAVVFYIYCSIFNSSLPRSVFIIYSFILFMLFITTRYIMRKVEEVDSIE